MSTPDAVQPAWAEAQPQGAELDHQAEHQRREHLLLDARPLKDVNGEMLQAMGRTGPRFWLVVAFFGALVVAWGAVWLYQMYYGLGVTGLNRPVMWALYIVNLVYFIGIGHAGTFISAALRVLHIEWRRPISRAAETLTVFALFTAAMFPIVHLGRPWKVYWLIPYPNERGLWPSFHSPLMWDFMAISTYLSCSIIFAYISLLPDMAMARDHSTGWRKRFFSILTLGWRGTEKEWATHETALNIFSYAIIPVMFSVHTVVSWDFAMAVQPGWHSTVFGPYFVLGALFSGTAAVIMILALLRKTMKLGYFLRDEHFNGMGIFLLILAMGWAYFYFNDYIVPWYGQDPVEKIMSQVLSHGWAAPLWYLMLFCNFVFPMATLWSRRVRTSMPALFIVALLVQVGMYLERYLIVPFTLGYNELPFDWGVYIPHVPETVISIAAFGLVIFLYILFTRFFPVIPLWEVYEGQAMHGLRRIGRALIPTRSEPE
jgi:Ni/Fe-hydrogenase subunit HybB-like protein